MHPDKRALMETLKEKVFHLASPPKEQVVELSGIFVRRQFPRKNVLVPAGEIWDKIFFIHRGIIRLFYTNEQGKEFNKGFFHEGRLVWPTAPSARKERSLFTIAALEDASISVCRFTTFHSWLKSHGYWEKFALPYAESFADEKFRREYEFLLNPAMVRYRNFCMENPDLADRIPDYHLASYLGVTNVALSRIKKRAVFNPG